jgi:pseudouridine synthase
VYELIADVPQFVGTVGRLDMDTSGLLLLTNDTILADRLTDPEHHVEKEYLVKAGHLISGEQLDQLGKGVELEDGRTRAAKVTRVRDAGKHTFLSIALTEGRNRQVRRMIGKIGSHVLKLVRVRIGPLQLEGLPLGKWRELTAKEVKELKDAGQKSKR